MTEIRTSILLIPADRYDVDSPVNVLFRTSIV